MIEIMDKLYMMPTSVRSAESCDCFHLFVDGTKTEYGHGAILKTEWFSYYSQSTIYTTNNFSYKRNPGRLKYSIKMESDDVFYTKDGKIRPKLTGLNMH
jgi:hypothetical protein